MTLVVAIPMAWRGAAPMAWHGAATVLKAVVPTVTLSERSGFFVGVPTFRRGALGAGGILSGATSTIGVCRCEPSCVALQ
jgi:hypothetical protein